MIARAPFVRIGIAAAAGVLAARYTDLPLWAVAAFAAVCYFMAWAAVRDSLSNGYLWLAVAFTFMVDARINTSPSASWSGNEMQTDAFERLQRLDLDPDELGSVAAMSIGWREAMSDTVVQSYRAAGMTHILAVSGLHVGIIFLFINMLLRLPMLIWRSSHKYTPYIAIALIWLYVVMTGASPSAVRAGTMFSFVQMSLAMSVRGDILNMLFAAAVAMIAVCPSTLFNVSFQMSFMALLSIAVWYLPLYGRVRSRYGVVNFLVGGVLLSVVVTLALAPLFSWVLGWLAHVQNSLTEWGAGLGAIDFRLTLTETLLFYALYLFATLYLYLCVDVNRERI